MEAEWRENVMDAVKSCDEVRLDRLLKMMGTVPTLKLDFSAYKRHFFKYLDGPRSMHYNFLGAATPLGFAVSKGYSRIAEQLLCAGASVDFADEAGNTPFFLSAVYGHKESCCLLLNHGADINLQDKYKKPVLYYAAYNGKSEVVSLLLEKGAVLHTCNKQNSSTGLPIVAAISGGHPQTTQTLLRHCEKVNLRVPLGALLQVGFSSSEECTGIVLRHGCYPIPDKYSSYFYKSAAYGWIKLMCLLLELNPQYMQEEWLVNQEYTYELNNHHPTFTSWLAEYRKHPPSLVKMSKSTILAQLGSYYTTKVRYLPLPSALKTFLATLQCAYDED